MMSRAEQGARQRCPAAEERGHILVRALERGIHRKEQARIQGKAVPRQTFPQAFLPKPDVPGLYGAFHHADPPVAAGDEVLDNRKRDGLCRGKV